MVLCNLLQGHGQGLKYTRGNLEFMCDLFAMSCNDEDRATRSLPIFSEYASRNPDGWGIGWFEGNNAALGVKTLAESDVDIIAATSLTDAVEQAVKAAGGE